jgi:hypothetical protein
VKSPFKLPRVPHPFLMLVSLALSGVGLANVASKRRAKLEASFTEFARERELCRVLFGYRKLALLGW